MLNPQTLRLGLKDKAKRKTVRQTSALAQSNADVSKNRQLRRHKGIISKNTSLGRLMVQSKKYMTNSLFNVPDISYFRTLN